MKIPDSISRILARQDVATTLSKYEREELPQAENIIIVSTEGKNISIHYAGLDTRSVIGLLEQAKNTLLTEE